MAIGQHVRLRLSNEQKERYATVYLIGRKSPERTVRVYCHLSAEDKIAYSGMAFSAIIETSGPKTSLPCPLDAVVSYAESFFAQPKTLRTNSLVEVERNPVKTVSPALTPAC